MRKNPPVANISRPMNSLMLRTDEIRRLRKAKGWTMAEAARRAGLNSAQHWNNIEKGWIPHIGAETLYAVAKALGVSMESLLSPDSPKPRKRK
jgi:transcriptional regulator with XRE-family HTH domain